MNGELAQRVALVSYGNAYLAGRAAREVEETTTFQFVHSLSFVASSTSRLRRSVRVGTASGWFALLADRGVWRLELDCLGQASRPLRGPLPEHIAVAFVSGEHAPIVALGKRGELWRASWSVAPGERPADDRIWDVRYEGEALHSPPVLVHPTVAEAAGELDEALVATEQFARAHVLGHWPDWMVEARGLLSADEPEIPYHRDLVAPSTSQPVRRLLAAAVKAYVFGGMGSWNDMGFEQPAAKAEYVALTARLYRAVMFALDAAVNTTAATD